MDRQGVTSRALLCLLVVVGADCDQPTDSSFGNYDGYQGPGYQATIQEIFQESLRALHEIVQLTLRAAKEELSQLAALWVGSCDFGDGETLDQGEVSQTADVSEEANFGTSTEHDYATTSDKPIVDDKTGTGLITSPSSSESATNGSRKKTKVTETTTLTTLVQGSKDTSKAIVPSSTSADVIGTQDAPQTEESAAEMKTD